MSKYLVTYAIEAPSPAALKIVLAEIEQETGLEPVSIKTETGEEIE